MTEHDIFKAESLSSLSGIDHAFFTRQGGVSTGIYASLNCGLGSADDGAAVTENRRRALRMAGWEGRPLLTVYQIHSNNVITVGTPFPDEERPRADALVTDQPGVVLGVLAADCAPVLFADPVAGVIGAAHAGWRGAVGGILDSTLRAMQRLGADPARVIAAIGPCIGATSYEVGSEFRAHFMAQLADNAAFFTEGQYGKFSFDLAGYITRRLTLLGIGAVSQLGLDTYADEENFFSYRRATHRGEKDYGRLLSAITLI